MLELARVISTAEKTELQELGTQPFLLLATIDRRLSPSLARGCVPPAPIVLVDVPAASLAVLGRPRASSFVT